MSNVQHVIGFKAWLLFSFLFRAKQACNQMQFIYRNDTTSTDHGKVSSLVWDKTPFMVSLKGWMESVSISEVSVREGSFHFLTLSYSKKLEALTKRANVDLGCWGQRACCEGHKSINFTTGQIKLFIYFYFMLFQIIIMMIKQLCLLWITLISCWRPGGLKYKARDGWRLCCHL